MPHSASAKKRHSQSLVRRARNRATKSVLRGLVRKVRETVVAGNHDDAAVQYRTLVKKFDQAAAKGIVHANQASRIKSRLSAHLKTAKTAKKA